MATIMVMGVCSLILFIKQCPLNIIQQHLALHVAIFGHLTKEINLKRKMLEDLGLMTILKYLSSDRYLTAPDLHLDVSKFN